MTLIRVSYPPFAIMNRSQLLSNIYYSALVLLAIVHAANACFRSNCEPSCDCNFLRQRHYEDNQIINLLRERESQNEQEKQSMRYQLDHSKDKLAQVEREMKDKTREHAIAIDEKDAELAAKDKYINDKTREHAIAIDKKDAALAAKDKYINDKVREHKMAIERKDADLAAKQRAVIHLMQKLGDMNTEHEACREEDMVKWEGKDAFESLRKVLAYEKEKRAQAENHLKWMWRFLILLLFVSIFLIILGYQYREWIRDRANSSGKWLKDSVHHYQKKWQDISKNKDFDNKYPIEHGQFEC